MEDHFDGRYVPSSPPILAPTDDLCDGRRTQSQSLVLASSRLEAIACTPHSAGLLAVVQMCLLLHLAANYHGKTLHPVASAAGPAMQRRLLLEWPGDGEGKVDTVSAEEATSPVHGEEERGRTAAAASPTAAR